MGFAPVTVYALDIAVIQYDAYVIGAGIPDACIRRACDLTARNRIPKRQSVSQYELFLLLYAMRNRLIEHRGDHPPEPVLRVPIEKVLFPGLD